MREGKDPEGRGGVPFSSSVDFTGNFCGSTAVVYDDDGRDAVESVDYRHGDALEPGEFSTAAEGGRFVHLVGQPVDGPGYSLREDGRTTSVLDLAMSLGASGALCLSTTNPLRVSRERDRVGLALAGVRGGVLTSSWPATGSNEFVRGFFSRAAHASRRSALVNALAETQRACISNDAPVWQWAAFRLFVPEVE